MSLPPRALSAQVEEDETSGTATHPPPPPRPPHTDPISPQTTSPTILRQDDTVSPQLTGVGSEISSVDALRSTQDLLSPSAQYQQYQQPDGNIHAHAPASETVEKQVAKPAYPGIEVVSPPYSERDAPASAYAPKVVEGYAPAPPQVQNGLNGRNYYAVAMPLRALQQGPGPVDCPICNVREVTRVEYMTGNYTHVSAFVLCCCVCLGCIPYMMHSMKDVEHHCGACNSILAIWHRSGSTEVVAHGHPT